MADRNNKAPAADDYGLVYKGDIRSESDILRDIVQTANNVPRPNWKQWAAGGLLGLITGAIAEHAAPGAGATAGLTAMSGTLGGAQNQMLLEHQQQMKGLDQELATRESISNRVLNLINSGQYEAIKGMDQNTLRNIIPGVELDPMSKVMHDNEDQAKRDKMKVAAEMVEAAKQIGDTDLLKTSLANYASIAGLELPTGALDNLNEMDFPQSARLMIAMAGMNGLGAIRKAWAARQAGDKSANPFNYLSDVESAFKTSPEYKAKITEGAKDLAFASFTKAHDWAVANPDKAKGLTLAQIAEQAGVPPTDIPLIQKFLANNVFDGDQGPANQFMMWMMNHMPKQDELTTMGLDPSTMQDMFFDQAVKQRVYAQWLASKFKATNSTARIEELMSGGKMTYNQAVDKFVKEMRAARDSTVKP